MAPSSVAVPVWYEPAPPPTPQPLLASETDIPDLSFNFEPLSHQEVDMSRRLAAPTCMLKAGPTPTVTFDIRRPDPAGDLAPERAATTMERGFSTNSDSDSTTSSDSEPESQNDADMKIAKPAGEVGRPGRGGYSLEQVLDWTPRRMSEFKKIVNKLVAECLDPTRSVSAQSLHRIALLRDKAMSKFPELDQYENAWPIMDAIKQRLKYTSSKARKHAHDAVAPEAPKRKSGKKLRSRLLQGDD